MIKAILLLCLALAQLTPPEPVTRENLDAVTRKLVIAHSANGVPMPWGVRSIYIDFAPPGALGGANTGMVGLSVRLLDEDVRYMVISTLAHELGHVYQRKRTNDETAMEIIGMEALANLAKRDDAALYAFIYNLRRRYGILYLKEVGYEPFLLEQGYTQGEIDEMKQALRLMPLSAYRDYYAEALPAMLRYARSGEPFIEPYTDIRMVADDTGDVLESLGLIKRRQSKAVRLLEAP